MRWLDEVSKVVDGSQQILGPGGKPLRRVPPNRYLPVVVAVRMSLSFPVLLSAVPLYAHDYSMHVDGEKPPPTKVWFSDGGISSNMPLHFFDAPLPGRPTFAINLKDEHPKHKIGEKIGNEQENRVYLPARNSAGRIRHWPKPKDDRPTGLFDFVWSIVTTMQNWRDQIQFPYPGYRDRIIQISQKENEGGLNLNMEPELIRDLSDAGEAAANRLIRRFAPGSDEGGWPNHEQIRLRTFLALAQDLVKHPEVRDPRWDEVAVHADGLDEGQRSLALLLLGRLRDLAREIDEHGSDLVEGAPRPRPQMRITPRI
jgi:hypothetical protein